MDMTSTYHLNIFKISKWFCVSSPTHWSWSSIVFSQGMEAIQLDGEILFGLLKRTSPAIHKHLKDQDVMPILYMQVRIIIQMLNIRWIHRSGSCVSSHAPFHGRRYSGYVFFLSDGDGNADGSPRYGTCSAARASRFSSGLRLFWSSTLYLARYHHPNHHLYKD